MFTQLQGQEYGKYFTNGKAATVNISFSQFNLSLF